MNKAVRSLQIACTLCVHRAYARKQDIKHPASAGLSFKPNLQQLSDQVGTSAGKYQ
jgi:hypothetical protein